MLSSWKEKFMKYRSAKRIQCQDLEQNFRNGHQKILRIYFFILNFHCLEEKAAMKYQVGMQIYIFVHLRDKFCMKADFASFY